jgi:hypothetical protein
MDSRPFWCSDLERTGFDWLNNFRARTTALFLTPYLIADASTPSPSAILARSIDKSSLPANKRNV